VTADDYVQLVSYELRDLPWRTRRELVTELNGHLAELPADTDFFGRLGRPEQYAADMRAAAGLERRHGAIAFLRARRLRYVILVVLTLTVAGLAIGAVVWINNYQPIRFAGAMQFPLDAKPSAGQAGETVVFRDGRPFQFGITIQNTGRFSVRVLGVPRGVTDFFVGQLLMSKDQGGNLNERPVERFQPFDMKPGSFRWLVFKGRFACSTGMGGGGGGVIREAVAVRFGFLWRTATAVVPLDEPLEISFPDGCTSPFLHR
jgi:hypothetical protein